jgi:hypothetical protein
MVPTIFTASCSWMGPNDSEKILYFSGITKKRITNISLVDSLDPAYTAGTAFKLVGTNPDDLGRVYKVNSQDELTVNSSISYGVDDYKSYLVFSTPVTASTINVVLERYYASIHKANLVSFEKIIDFENQAERAITSMVAADDGIYLAGVSGKIWFYNGEYISGPIFILQENSVDLSASSMISHKFEHEDESYLYVASDQLPRLFRAKLNTAYNGSQWEQVYPYGELAANSGGILSMVSAYNKLFLGSLNKKIHRYSRTLTVSLSEPTNLITEEVIVKETETESLSTSTLISNNITDYEATDFGIRCLAVGKNQVMAGIDKKPEVWSYSEIPLSNPKTDESWASLKFDEVFMSDPAPAQFYSYDSNTLSRNDQNVAIARFPEDNNPQKFNEFLVIKGNTVSSTGATAYGSRLYEISEGSDWEQLLRANLPNQDYINVKCASWKAISSWNNFTSLDGYDLVINDLFLLKDQTASGTNGIYNGVYVFNGVNNTPSLVNITQYIISGSTVLGFYIETGYINTGNRWLLNYADYLSSGNFIVYKPSYTFEASVINLNSSQAASSTDLRNETTLNSSEQIPTNSLAGYQGFKIADLYGQYSIEFNSSNLKLSSGMNSVEKTITTTGLVADWQFYTVSNSTVTSSKQSWAIGQFIKDLSATTETNYDIFDDPYSKYVLKITPALTGNPSIVIDNLNLDVDLNSVISIRVKAKPKSKALDTGAIKAYWAYDGGIFNVSSETSLHSSDDYIEYKISPIWKGTIGKLQIEFFNLPENNERPNEIVIDLIQIQSNEDVFDINNKLSKIRWIVEDRDIKIYLGQQKNPFIEKKNFISLDTYSSKYLDPNANSYDYDHPYIQFGKLNNDAGDSLVGYSDVSFIIGETYEPTNCKVIDFNQSVVLPSTGGVRLFTYHDGTLYCATDGFISEKISDNPNDRQSKIFFYNSNAESWFLEDINFERKKVFDNAGNYTLYGVIRPLTAISYKGKLFLSGHYGNIKP